MRSHVVDLVANADPALGEAGLLSDLTQLRHEVLPFADAQPVQVFALSRADGTPTMRAPTAAP